MTSKKLKFKIYKEYLQINYVKTVKTWAKDVNRN